MRPREEFDSGAGLLMWCVIGAWVGNALYAWGALSGPLKEWSPALVATSMITFVIAHGRRQWSARTVWLFPLIIFAVAWALESISIQSGFPFGRYQYGESMRPFIGSVPVFVPIAYWIMGYICWNMAILFYDRSHLPRRRNAWLHPVPLIGAALMVLWDFCMDPLRATAEQRWHWLDDGVYHGIPATNFMGWFFVTWLMLQLFALCRARQDARWWARARPRDRKFWISVPLLYMAFPIEYMLNPVFAFVRDRIDLNADIIAIYNATALTTMITMVPVSLMAIVLVFRPRLLREPVRRWNAAIRAVDRP